VRLQTNRFENWFGRLLSIREAGIIPVPDRKISVSIDPLATMGFEQRIHQGVRSFQIATSRAASIGNNGKLSIYNPPGSKYLVVVESATIYLAAAGDCNMRIGSTDEGDAASNFAVCTDFRTIVLQAGYPAFTSTASGVVQRSGDAAIIAGTNATLISTATIPAVTVGPIGPYVIPPGFGFKMIGPVNTAARFELKWYERLAEAPELQP